LGYLYKLEHLLVSLTSRGEACPTHHLAEHIKVAITVRGTPKPLQRFRYNQIRIFYQASWQAIAPPGWPYGQTQLKMAAGTTEQKAEKSYLSSAVESINPWAGSQSSTPTLKGELKHPTTGDHSVNHFYGLSLRNYPPECPPLNVLWFHAVDIPKRKPQFLKGRRKNAEDPKDTKPPAQPKKFVAFSSSDSRSIETAYQKLLEQTEDSRSSKRYSTNFSVSTKVPVNEDFLFDVDIEHRELAPVYWLGPIYEVRRGTWFAQDGSPCEENLAAQLEDGYLKQKPWLNSPMRLRSDSGAKDLTPKASSENLQAASQAAEATAKSSQPGSQPQPQTYRLFGTYMNSFVTFQDANTAWLSSDGMLSWVASTMYEKFAGGGYLSGIKLVRGYTELGKTKTDDKPPSTPTESPTDAHIDEKQQKLMKRRSAPPTSQPSRRADSTENRQAETEPRESRLERQLSSLMEVPDQRDPHKQEEEIRKREEKEILDDYNARDGETQGREIEHLILVTHGIGQLLGLRSALQLSSHAFEVLMHHRMESVNFVHDCNVMRKTLKSVYSQSTNLRALNSELGDGPGNCRVQGT
jgi:hypothetical protein